MVSVAEYKENPKICTVAAVIRYHETAYVFRKEPFLFLTNDGTRPAPGTVARWVHLLLHRDVICEPPGSCRSASSSFAVFSGFELSRILDMVGWSLETTFQKYYNRPIVRHGENLFAASS